MELAHALDDGLAELLVDRDAEGGILEGQPIERHRHLLLIGLGLGLDLHLDDGIGEVHALEHDGLVRIAQRLAGAYVLQARQRNDVAGVGFLDLFAVVGMHQEHAPDALLLVVRRVHQRDADSILPE